MVDVAMNDDDDNNVMSTTKVERRRIMRSERYLFFLLHMKETPEAGSAGEAELWFVIVFGTTNNGG